MDLGWREAAIEALKIAQTAMHYTDIAEAIVIGGFRSEVGATPAISVNVAIRKSIKEDGDASPFVLVGRGMYALRHKLASTPPPAMVVEEAQEDLDETGLINAFGMYWSRSYVLWSPTPRILGQQQLESTSVDFCHQRGVYLLHDGRSVVYVGRTTDQPLGVRLRQHVADRLNGRWDRFSWFGTMTVNETGSLVAPSNATFNLDLLIVTMEALLIEGLEPPQNRKRGDDFRAIEYLQVEDPDIKKRNIIALMDELKAKL